MPPTLSARLSARDVPLQGTAVMKQNWRNLLFLHWEQDPQEIQRALPKGLYVDTFYDKTYIGIIPFFLEDVRPLYLPSIPFLSSFLEVNVRCYVYDENGLPGIWFYSLDANSLPTVFGANFFLDLPYHYANISGHILENGDIDYRCERKDSQKTAQFVYSAPRGEAFSAPADSLEFFLIERYVAFKQNREGRISQLRVVHEPYPLFRTAVKQAGRELFSLNRLLDPAREPDHVLVSSGVNVQIYV